MADLVMTATPFGARLQVHSTSASLADIYLWLHHSSDFSNPVTMGPVDASGFSGPYDYWANGRLWYYDKQPFGGKWDVAFRLAAYTESERRWEIRWGFELDEQMDWYGFTAPLDLDPAFSHRWHDGHVYTTASNGWPDTCDPESTTKPAEQGEHIEGFAWIELSDGITKFQRGPTTFPQEWHHPDLVRTSADLLVDVNCTRTIELGWFTGEFRRYNNLSTVKSPLYWQGTETLRVGWW